MTIQESITKYGPAESSDATLLAAALGLKPEAAERILHKAGGLRALLRFPDMGSPKMPATLAKLEALGELVRRSQRSEERLRITSPRAAGDYLLPRCQGWTEERFGLLALNAKGEVLGERIIGHGTASALLISPREVFREALRLGASSCLVFHNHPSGDPTPSREDEMLTKRLRQCGESLGVPLADHLVIGSESYHSFRASQGWDNEVSR